MNPDTNHLESAIAILKQKSESIQSRQDAILTILKEFRMEHFELFETILSDEEDEAQVRMMVALCLGKLGTPDCIVILEKQVNHPDPLLRSYIIQALGMTNDELALPLIVNALQDSNNTVFASASQCLSQFGKKAVPYLVDLLVDGKDDERCIAAWNLGEIAEKTCVPQLVENVLHEQNDEVLALSIWALGRIGEYSDAVIDSLKKASERDTPEVRLRAEVALKKIARNLN